MKFQFYSITIICIIIFVCSSCSSTRQTTCPTFANKTEKVHKPLFSKKSSSKKKQKQFARVTNQTEEKKVKNNDVAKIEEVISKIEMQELTASTDNDITLNINDLKQNTNDFASNTNDFAPSLKESKLQKFIYKKIEKKSEKILKKINQNHKNTTSKKEHKIKLKKIFNGKDDSLTDERETHELAIISLTTGILIFLMPLLGSLIGGWFLIPVLIFGILATVFGAKAGKIIKENPDKYKGKGIALAGLILGIIGLSAILALITLILLLLATWGN